MSGALIFDFLSGTSRTLALFFSKEPKLSSSITARYLAVGESSNTLHHIIMEGVVVCPVRVLPIGMEQTCTGWGRVVGDRCTTFCPPGMVRTAQSAPSKSDATRWAASSVETCLETGEWDHEIPACVAPHSCANPTVEWKGAATAPEYVARLVGDYVLDDAAGKVEGSSVFKCDDEAAACDGQILYKTITDRTMWVIDSNMDPAGKRIRECVVCLFVHPLTTSAYLHNRASPTHRCSSSRCMRALQCLFLFYVYHCIRFDLFPICFISRFASPFSCLPPPSFPTGYFAYSNGDADHPADHLTAFTVYTNGAANVSAWKEYMDIQISCPSVVATETTTAAAVVTTSVPTTTVAPAVASTTSMPTTTATPLTTTVPAALAPFNAATGYGTGICLTANSACPASVKSLCPTASPVAECDKSRDDTFFLAKGAEIYKWSHEVRTPVPPFPRSPPSPLPSFPPSLLPHTVQT